ncbi:Cytidylate kinase [Buchnera aphidicola (Neophyllaphis podocarpi)]|uniref:(d)CMP kinase n=1 Tax=Buchnera aphidicola TaxID=9 RepID=UPI00346494EE
MNIVPVITIDGLSSTGKSSLCKIISKKLNWNVLYSGIFYRILAYIYININKNIFDKKIFSYFMDFEIKSSCNEKSIQVIFQEIEIYKKLLLPEISILASKLSQFYFVRKSLLDIQKSFRKEPGLVADGRDMGTILFPDAYIKFFLYSDIKKRSLHRMIQLQEQGVNVNLKTVINEVKKRDYRDLHRIYSPVIPAKNAILIDVTSMTLKEVVNFSIKKIKNLF